MKSGHRVHQTGLFAACYSHFMPRLVLGESGWCSDLGRRDRTKARVWSEGRDGGVGAIIDMAGWVRRPPDADTMNVVSNIDADGMKPGMKSGMRTEDRTDDGTGMMKSGMRTDDGTGMKSGIRTGRSWHEDWHQELA